MAHLPSADCNETEGYTCRRTVEDSRPESLRLYQRRRENKALSTLSYKSATVAENGETTPNSATVALFCDSVDRA